MDLNLEALRKSLDLTQAEFANYMGVPFRTYQDLEQGKSICRPVHLKAAERAALAVAVERGNPMLAPASIRKEALKLAQMMVE